MAIVSCNECEKLIAKTDEASIFDEYTTEFSVIENSKTYNALIGNNEIKYESAEASLGNFTSYMQRLEFDSLIYEYDSVDLIIDYYHLSNGCENFIPKMSKNGDSVIIKCVSIGFADLECKDDKIYTQLEKYTCMGVMLWGIQIKKERLSGKKVYFQPFSNKLFDVTEVN